MDACREDYSGSSEWREGVKWRVERGRVLKASPQPLPTRTYFCHFKCNPGQRKSAQTEVMHEILISMNVHMTAQSNLVSDGEIKTSKKITLSSV